MKNILKIFAFLFILIFFTGCFNSKNEENQVLDSGTQNKENVNYKEIREKEFYLGVDISNFSEEEKNNIKEILNLDENFNFLINKTIIKNFDNKKLKILSSDYIQYDTNIYFKGEIIKEADSESFKILSRKINGKNIDGNYAKDKNYVYEYGKIIEGIDTKSFEIFDNGYSKDRNFIYNFPLDSGKLGKEKLIEADYESFEVIGFGIAKDKNNFYIDGKILKTDYETTEILNENYIKDKNGVYYGANFLEKIEGADKKTFQIVDDYIVKDKNFVYSSKNRKKGIDPKTFKKIGEGFYKDKNHIYNGFLQKLDVDYDSFKVDGMLGIDKNFIYNNFGEKIGDNNGFKKENLPFIIKNNKLYIIFLGYPIEIKGFTVKNFKHIGNGYIKNNEKIYSFNMNTGELIKIETDENSFKILNQNHTIDKNNAYFQNKIIEGVDLKTFEVLTEKHSKDKNNLYYEGKKLKEAN